MLLLAEPGNFYAAYIRSALECCGVSLVVLQSDPANSRPGLDEDEFAAIVGCVAVDLSVDTFVALGIEHWKFPVLFVGGSTGIGLPGAYAWMQAPFASYQVIETLLKLMPVPESPSREI
jgi:hypothetical protein